MMMRNLNIDIHLFVEICTVSLSFQLRNNVCGIKWYTYVNAYKIKSMEKISENTFMAKMSNKKLDEKLLKKIIKNL